MRGLVALGLVLAAGWAPGAAALERPVSLTDSSGVVHHGVLALPRGYGSAWNPPLPLVLVPEGDSVGSRWGGLSERGGFALLRLRGGPAQAGGLAIERLGELPAVLRASVPWLRLAPGRTYAFGDGEAGRRALRLAVARPRLLAGVAVSEPFGEGETLPSGARVAFSQVPVQLWTATPEGRRRSAGFVRAVRTARAGGRILAARGSWPEQLQAALLGFGLLPLGSEPVERRPARAAVCGSAGTLSYPWPVRPFDRAHPVRGNVGDPRTHFDLGEPASGAAAGRFAFHDGVDVVAVGGTPVYPVVSGTAEPAGRYGIVVRSPGGRSFVYQHLLPAVGAGAEVRAGETVLGHVLARSGHVHLGEFAPSGAVVNPLVHLTPYRDETAPVLALLDAPERARGRLELSARAYDVPELAAGGSWTGLPVAPARITLSLRNRDGRTVGTAAAVDFVAGLPGNGAFRDVYLPGTRQNASVVGFHYFTGSPGSYRYRLGLDVRQVAPGRYDLVVRATDTCGNADESIRPLVVLRDPSYRPPQPKAPPTTKPEPALPPPPPVELPPLAGRYTVVLASVRGPEGPRAAAAALRRASAAGLPRVSIVHSDRYGGLTPGYLVVVSGSYGSAAEAARAAIPATRTFSGAYPRLVGEERARSGRKGRE